MDNKHIGLYFGSFNPIHIGHLAIVGFVSEFCNFDEIWLVVSPRNPLKDKNSLENETHRLEMVKTSLKEMSIPAKVCNIETKLPKPNYTIKTLETLEKKYKNYRFSIIAGADSIENLNKWFQYRKILKKYEIYVYPRVGVSSKKICKKYNVKIINAPLMEISSSLIRKCIRENRNYNAFVTPRVRRYIKKHKLYENVNTAETKKTNENIIDK